MPLTPDPPFPKTQGDGIRSKDWNDAINEIIRLDNAKVNKAGDAMTGPLSVGGHLSVGTGTPENAEGWNKVLDVLGTGHAKLSVRTAAIDARVLSHDTGFFGAPAGMIVGTKSAHPLSLATGGVSRLTIANTGNVGIGTAVPGAFKLNIAGTGGQNALHVASDFALRGNDKLNLIRFGNDGDYQILHKASGALGRNTLAMHVHADDAFGVYSSSWNPLLEVEGGTGNVYVRGSVGIGGSPSYPLHVTKDFSGNWQARFTNGTANVYLSHSAGYGIHINTGQANSAQRYGLEVRNNQRTHLYVRDDGSVGIGTTNPSDVLDVNGAVRFLTGFNPIRFTAGWTSFPDGATDRAEISNDTGTYKTLMIVGNKSAGLGRRVSVWDRLEVNGPLIVQQAHTIKIGVPSPSGRYANDGIRGEPNLWLDATGTVFIKQGFQAVSGFDIAERFRTVGEARPGDVVVFDADVNAVRLCDSGYDAKVVGIASAEPAFILGAREEQVPIALCGRVPCNVDADIAPVAAGDLLTTSPTQGYAQKAVDREKATGAIIGKALGSLERGKGQVEVLIMMR